MAKQSQADAKAEQVADQIAPKASNAMNVDYIAFGHDPIVGVKEACRVLQCSRTTLWRLMRRGVVRRVHLKGVRRTYIGRYSLLEALEVIGAEKAKGEQQ